MAPDPIRQTSSAAVHDRLTIILIDGLLDDRVRGRC